MRLPFWDAFLEPQAQFKVLPEPPMHPFCSLMNFAVALV